MGRSGPRLWEADAPLDALSLVTGSIERDIIRYAHTKSGPRTAVRLAAAIGILLQCSVYSLTPENERLFPMLVRALSKHERGLATLGPDAAETLTAVREGRARDLVGEAPAETSVLYATLGRAGARVRRESLFSGPLAARYVQKIANRCAARVEDDIEGFAEDGFYEDGVLGPLGLLAILQGWKLSPNRITRWRVTATQSWEAMVATSPGDESIEYMQTHLWPRLLKLFDLLEARAA